MRLIDADELKKEIIDGGYSHYFEIFKIIDNAQTVEPDTMRLALIDDIRQKQNSADKAFLEGYEKGKHDRSQAEWIIHPHSMIMKCSLCGNEENAKDVGTINPDKHFCSFCGADMRGNIKRKGTPIEGNNESYNCDNWIP
jgi:hypothetical protein